MYSCFKIWIGGITRVLFFLILAIRSSAQPSDLQPTFTGINGLPSSSINQIIKDDSDRIWIATESGLSIKNTTDRRLIELQRENNKSVKQIAFTDKYVFIALLDKLKIYERKSLQLLKEYNATSIGIVRKIRIIDDYVWILTNKHVFKNSGLLLDSVHFTKSKKVALDIAKFNGNVRLITYPYTDLLTYNGREFIETGLTNIVSPNYEFNYLSLKVYNDTLFLGGDHAYAYLTKENKVFKKDLEFKLNSNPSIWDIIKIKNRLLFAVGNSNQTKYGGVISPNLTDFHKFSKLYYAQCLFYDENKDALWIGTQQDGVYIVNNASKTYYSGNATFVASRYDPSYFLYDDSSLAKIPQLQDEDISTSKNIKIRYRGSFRKAKTIGDTTYLMDIQAVSMQSKGFRKEIWNSHAFKWGYYFTDCFRLGDSLYEFCLYNPALIFNLKTFTLTKFGPPNDFPKTTQSGNKIFCHNQGIGFRFYDNQGAYELTAPNYHLENIEDFAVADNKLYVLTKNILQTFQINDKCLIFLESCSLKNKIEDFNAKWVVASNKGKLFLIGETDIIGWRNNTPISHTFLGNGKLENKPTYDVLNQLVIAKGGYTSFLNETDLENKNRKSNFHISLPNHILETNSAVAAFSGNDFLAESHSLKAIQVLQNNVIVYEKYFLGNSTLIPSTIKHGDYEVVFIANGKEIERKELTIKLPLDRNPLFFTAIGLGLLFMGFLFFKIQYDKKTYAKRILNNKIEMLQKNLNPHFIFNSLNLIYSNILSENKEDALKVLLNFSKLQRNFLERSKLKKVTLESELDFIKSYMNLEISRYENDIKLNYVLTESPDISLDKIFIPPNIFQPLIENSIKYGLLGYKGEEKKVIYMDVYLQKGQPIVSIENPLGKQSKKKDVFSTGMGMLIVKERIDLYNQEMNTNLEFQYGLPAHDFKSGYRVEIYLGKKRKNQIKPMPNSL